MRLVSLAAVAAVVTATAAGAAGPARVFDVAAGGDGARLERIYYGRVTDTEVRARVASNGCTDEDSFDVDVSRVEAEAGAPPRFAVALVRKGADECRRERPNGVYVKYSREELGLPADAAVVIANPVRRRNY